jgi:tetratricopeptide (TPR) repeat protein
MSTADSQFEEYGPVPAAADVRSQLKRILDHQLFRSSHRLSSFITYVVEKTLTGDAGALKEYAIGVEVFARPSSYSPQDDPVVRIMAGRLRSKLAEYYHTAGPADPILIEIPRGGYATRFRFQRAKEEPAEEGPQRLISSRRVRSVGRERELAKLKEAYSSVCAGAGAVVTVSGDAGLGKTTLVEDFLAFVEQAGSAYVARGRCSERLAQSDPFSALLECVAGLTASDTTGQVAGLLQNAAPSWFSQAVPHTASLDSQASRSSHERMRREILAFLERLSQTRTVILFLDDLHWADASTCDLLAYLGGRIDRARVLILGAYRPAVISSKGHPFFAAKAELERRGVSIDIPLSFLALHDVRRFIELEFPNHAFPPDFADVVHARTDGNPLFMVDMLRFLCVRGIVTLSNETWKLEQTLAEVGKVIPLGIRSMIQLKIDQLANEDRNLLLCASVQGIEFDSAALAPVLSLEPVDIEERLQYLETAHTFLQILGERDFPNGTLSLRCRFQHVFYQNALHDSLAPSRRAAYSLAIAQQLEKLLGPQSATAAAELAVLFETGRDYQNAVRCFLQAARAAARVFAYPEAAILCRRGLKRLASLPETESGDSQELVFSLTLGMSLMATRGYAAREAEVVHRRSRELCLKLGQPRRLLLVLWGLHTCDANRGELLPALAVANEMRQTAESLADPFARVEALFAEGSTLGFMGEWQASCDAFERVIQDYPISRHELRSSQYVLDPCVGSLSLLGRVLTFTGLVDQGLSRARQAVELANRLAHPPTVAYATFWLGFVLHARHEYADCIRHMEFAMSLSEEHDLPLFVEWARIVLGSAWTQTGRVADGIAEMRKSVENQTRLGSWLERSYCLTLLAEALQAQGEATEALTLCEEALQFAQRSGGRCYEPDTRRVRAEVLLSLGEPARLRKIEDDFQGALQLARACGCRLLELRAAVNYFRFHRRVGDSTAAQPVLEQVLEGWTEGLDTPLLRQSFELLGMAGRKEYRLTALN